VSRVECRQRKGPRRAGYQWQRRPAGVEDGVVWAVAAMWAGAVPAQRQPWRWRRSVCDARCVFDALEGARLEAWLCRWRTMRKHESHE